MSLSNVKAKTFHGFANELVKAKNTREQKKVFVRGERNGLSALDEMFKELLKDKHYYKSFIEFFLYFLKIFSRVT